MPPKKRPNLNPQRKCDKRSKQSENDYNIQLERKRLAERNAMLNESPEARVTRQQSKRIMQFDSRSNETPTQLARRREIERLRNITFIQNQSSDQTTARLEANRSRQQNSTWSIYTEESFKYNPLMEYDTFNAIQIKAMSKICQFCDAKKYEGEPIGMCCSGGKVVLQQLEEPPEPLKTLMTNQTRESKKFLKLIRKYNSSFQMTSFGTSHPIQHHGYMPTFKIQGQVYHKSGSLLPLLNEAPKFLQIYFMGDEVEQANIRGNHNPGTENDIILSLQQMLHQHNIYLQSFKTALEKMPNDDMQIVIHSNKTPPGSHERRFNAPTVNEVAIVISGNDFDKRDIVITKRNNELKRIPETHRSYDSLQYPIMFPRGEDGYSISIHQVNPVTKLDLNSKVSSKDYYAFRIMIRDSNSNHILKCRQLFHQYLVDMYAKVESERLLYIRLNQSTLRAEQYAHLKDAIRTDGNPNNHGKLIILPSSFQGSPRHMHEYTQDSMTYVKNYGRPDLFITFTCNPNWDEIKLSLFEGQSPSDRHDICARVFRQKVIKFIHSLTKGKLFGQVR